MSKTFVIGDIHGADLALKQCLERSAFNYETDHLICLGDVCDGWPETKNCIEELLLIKNLTYILGNHDYWALDWMKDGHIDDMWERQGGRATMTSYANGVPEAHISLLEQALPYYITNNKLFVHAGIDPLQPLEKQDLNTFLWDRRMAKTALDFYIKKIDGQLTDFDEVYLGHTPIPFSRPIKSFEIWLMDTGAGWSGLLSLMDIDTKEIYVSDPVPSLYPGVKGRVKAVK